MQGSGIHLAAATGIATLCSLCSTGLETWEVSTEWRSPITVEPNRVDSLTTWKMVYQTHKRNLFRVLEPWTQAQKPTSAMLIEPAANVLYPRIVLFLYRFLRCSMIWSLLPSLFRKWGYYRHR